MNKLQDFKENKGLTQEQLAALIGCDRSHVSKLLSGKAFPSRKLAIEIADKTGGAVPVTSWFEVTQ